MPGEENTREEEWWRGPTGALTEGRAATSHADKRGREEDGNGFQLEPEEGEKKDDDDEIEDKRVILPP